MLALTTERGRRERALGLGSSNADLNYSLRLVKSLVPHLVLCANRYVVTT